MNEWSLRQKLKAEEVSGGAGPCNSLSFSFYVQMVNQWRVSSRREQWSICIKDSNQFFRTTFDLLLRKLIVCINLWSSGKSEGYRCLKVNSSEILWFSVSMGILSDQSLKAKQYDLLLKSGMGNSMMEIVVVCPLRCGCSARGQEIGPWHLRKEDIRGNPW